MIEFNYDRIRNTKQVTPELMKEVRAALDTKNFRGSVMELSDYYTDCPSVIRYQGRFYMYFIAIPKDVSKSGYETHIAASDDLLHWGYIGRLLCRDDSRIWDSKQIAGYAALYNIEWNGGCELKTANDGRYYLTYLAGAQDGYEPDPLFMGIASSPDPLDKNAFVRCDKSILSPSDPDARLFETKTLYKSTVIRDTEGLTGFEYVMYYNAKAYDNRERIYMAVSDNMVNWKRYGRFPVIDDITGDPAGLITGDPMITRYKDAYVMSFFKYRMGGGAYDTFAVSYDLVNWVEWLGEPTIKPLKDNPALDVHAHKPWIVTWEDKVYHFFCACTNDNRRYIALSTNF
jgi:predicted GH43/DUF377 family glycosyl hydrolase